MQRLTVYGGTDFWCPICTHRFRRWNSHAKMDWDLVCPRCESRPRHRMMWLWLEREAGFFDGSSKRVLHFAPERGIRARLRSLSELNYVCTDITTGSADLVFDIAEAPLRAGSFDVILCNHVLEFVPDDRRAMTDLVRVLRPGGFAVLMVPYRPEAKTEEDLTAPAEEMRFGLEGELRVYGNDYVGRLQAAGFQASAARYGDELDSALRRQLGLQAGEYLIVGYKPHS